MAEYSSQFLTIQVAEFSAAEDLFIFHLALTVDTYEYCG